MNATHVAGQPALCEVIFAAGDGLLRQWWVDAAVASASFAASIWFWRAREYADSVSKGGSFFENEWVLVPALAAYWVGILIWRALVPAPPHMEDGCPTSTAGGSLRLVVEVVYGIVAYDALFFCLHWSFHRFPACGRCARHTRHHSCGKTDLSAPKVLDHSLFDGTLQVLVNIAVQRHSPIYGASKTRLARFFHNVIVTFMLTESHSTAEWPKVFRNALFPGVRDHHLHHAYGGPPYQQFFGHLDALARFLGLSGRPTRKLRKNIE